LIEALTYRIGAHSTADDAGRYRADAEVEAARSLHPISRYRTWLIGAGHADQDFVVGCEVEADTFAMEVRAGVIATPAPPVEWMFDWTFAAPSEGFQRMRREALGG
jgi:pyruvate dehydrogenase E1 component alpha subunit